VVVAGGAGDNAAAACGVGVVTPGSAFVSIGTSGVLFVSNAAFSPNTAGAVHAFCHALPATWHQMGVILSASDSLEWLARIAGQTRRRARRRGRPGHRALGRHLPALSLGRAHAAQRRRRARAFTGLSQSSGVADLAQAVMEGVAYAFADCKRVLHDAGTDFDSALAVGGGARSETWLRIIASVLDRPLKLPADSDVGAALGAARLAICAAEGADPAEVCTPPAITRVIDPDPALVPRYAEGHARYRALHPAIRDRYR
jgi:xylulokinase